MNPKLVAAIERMLDAVDDVEKRSDGHPEDAFVTLHDAAMVLHYRLAGEQVAEAVARALEGKDA